jgi:hypothetical protein
MTACAALCCSECPRVCSVICSSARCSELQSTRPRVCAAQAPGRKPWGALQHRMPQSVRGASAGARAGSLSGAAHTRFAAECVCCALQHALGLLHHAGLMGCRGVRVAPQSVRLAAVVTLMGRHTL